MKTPPRPDIWKNSPWTETILNSTDDAVIITDPDLQVVKWNLAVEQLVRDKEETLAGRNIIEILEGIHCNPEGITEKWPLLLKSGTLQEDIILTNPDGEPLYLSCYIHKFPGSDKTSAIVITIRDLKKQVDAIHASASFYKTLFDTLCEGVLLVTSQNATVITGNKRAWEILKVSEKTVVGQSLLHTNWKIIHEDGSEFKHDDIPAIITLNSGKTVENVIMGIKRPSGKITWLSVNSSFFAQGPGILPRCSVVSFTDITSQKAAETRAQENESIFHSYLNNSLAPAWIADEDGYVLFLNDLGRHIWKIGENYRFKHVYDLFPKEAAEEFLASDRQVFETNNPLTFTIESLRKDGSQGFYMLHKFLLPLSASKRLIAGQAIDITEEKNAQEALRSSNERFSFVAKAISDCIWDWNIETGQIYRSESLVKLTGHTEHSIENNQNWWFEKIHPDDLDRVKNNISSCLEKGLDHWHDEYRFLCADNSYKYIVDTGYIVYKDEKPIRAIGAVQDVTENKKLEAKLQLQKNQQQKEINRTIIATQDYERNELGKELHDNVNQILATTSLLLGNTKGRTIEEKEEFTGKAQDYIKLAIEELRKISKSLNTSVVEQTGLIEPIEDIVANLRLNKNITVRFECRNYVEQKLSSGQKLMIYRIIQEQTNNIVKYAEASKISIVIQKEERSCSLTISDNGKGFDLKQSRKGIGLANIRHRVEAFNGTMDIDSAPGKGCSLKVLVPLIS